MFSPDGQRVLTASSDSTAKIWDARTGSSDDAERIARFAEAVAMRRLPPSGAMVPIPPDSASLILDEFRREASSSKRATPGSLLEFLRWYFAKPSARPAIPGG